MTEDAGSPLPEAALYLVAPDPQAIVLQDYVPFTGSLDWHLARAYWGQVGPQAFLDGSVPYGVNNDGRSAGDAAQVFLTAAADAPVDEPLIVLEFGSGSGVFAKLFLDAVAARERAIYERTTYWLTDRSEIMVAALRDGELLAPHRGRTEFRVVEAVDPGEALDEILAGHGARGFQAIFANYLLDNLPVTALVEAEGGLRELVVRTCLERGFRASEFGFPSLDVVLERAKAEDYAALLPLFGTMVLDGAYRAVDPGTVPHADLLEAGKVGGGGIIHSFGALDCVAAAVPRLAPRGFFLIADFGAAEGDTSPGGLTYCLYGGSLAVGVNFRQLAAAVAQQGARWITPTQDAASVRTRMILGAELPEVEARFRKLFAGERLDARRRRLEQIGNDRERGLADRVRNAFISLIAEEPTNWTVLQAAALFLAEDLQEYARAIGIARAGVAVNPMAPGLWTVLGIAHLGLGDWSGAEEYLRRGIALNPRGVEGRRHLARILARTGRAAEALEVLGRALAEDDGSERPRLLELQGRILEHEASVRRVRARRGVNRLRGILPGSAPDPDA